MIAMALFAIAVSTVIAAENDKPRLKVAADIWCPYNCEPGGEKQGYLIDVLQEVFAPHGIEIAYDLMPWRRALVSAETGQIDAAVGAVAGNHGANIIGRESLGVDETVFVVRSDETFTYSNANDLDGRTVGVIANYTYDNGGALDVYLGQRVQGTDRIFTVHQEQPLVSLFSMLLNGRIDLFPENRFVAQYAASTLGYADKVNFIDTGVGDNVYVAFSPNERGRNYLRIFDERVGNMKRSGRLVKLMAKYGIAPVNR